MILINKIQMIIDFLQDQDNCQPSDYWVKKKIANLLQTSFAVGKQARRRSQALADKQLIVKQTERDDVGKESESFVYTRAQGVPAIFNGAASSRIIIIVPRKWAIAAKEDFARRPTVGPTLRRRKKSGLRRGNFCGIKRGDIIKTDTQKRIEPVSGARRRVRASRVIAIRNAAAFYAPAPVSPGVAPRRRASEIEPAALSNCVNSSSLEPITEPAIFAFHFHDFFLSSLYTIQSRRYSQRG